MAEASLYRYKGFNMWERARYSRDLAKAVGSNAQLSRELPLVVTGYRNPIRGFRRIAKQAAKRDVLAAHVIDVQGRGIGAASAEISRPDPDELKTRFSGEQAVELSYWHEDVSELQAIRYGISVVRQLAAVAKQSPYSGEVLWMVTLPDDEVKTAVCETLQFAQIEVPQPYHLLDGVDEPRQLWARE